MIQKITGARIDRQTHGFIVGGLPGSAGASLHTERGPDPVSS